MIGVSKTFGGGSIPSSPVEKPEANASGFFCFLFYLKDIYMQLENFDMSIEENINIVFK